MALYFSYKFKNKIHKIDFFICLVYIYVEVLAHFLGKKDLMINVLINDVNHNIRHIN